MTVVRHLAFDLGAESGRAIVGSISDAKLTLEEIHRFPTQGLLVNGSLRWDIYRFFSEIKKSLAKYVERYGKDLSSIGVDTWGVDFGLLDGNGKLVGIPYHYRDERTNGADKIIDKTLGNEKLYFSTGIQLLPFNTINQLVSMKRDNDPSLTIGENLLFIGDLLHFFLTGRAVSEFTVASISQLYNPIKQTWDDSILEAFGLPKELKTEIVQAGSVIGPLKEDIALECSLGKETLVIAPAVHDTASAAVSVPSEGEEWAYLSSGTWSIAGFELDEANIEKKSYEMNISNSGGVLGKTLYLKNVMGLWIIQQCKKYWNKDNPEVDYIEIERLTQSAEPFMAYIDVDDSSFLNPDNMPEAIVDYFNKTDQKALASTNVGQISRIVFESLAFKYRFVFAQLSEATGKKFKTLHIIGGGSQNNTLNRFTSDALGVKVITGPIEASAIGNILMQHYGAGYLSSLSEIRDMVKRSFLVEEFQPHKQNLWVNKYEEFLIKTGLGKG